MNDLRIDYDRVAENYDLYVTADYDFSFFLTEIAQTTGPVLELMAGTGRLSLQLARAGARLTCVDASRGMLDVLSRKLQQHGLHADVLCADICQLRVQTPFQLALLPFQSFMEILGEDRQRQALAAIHGCLAPGGRFVCTMHNPAVRRAQVDGTLRLVGSFPTPDGLLIVSGFERGGDPVVERLQLFEFFDHDGSLRAKQVQPMKFALIDKEAFEIMATDAGFRVLELFGTYGRTPFDAALSPAMIWVLQKR